MDLKENKWYYTRETASRFRAWYIKDKGRWVAFIDKFEYNGADLIPGELLIITDAPAELSTITNIANSKNLTALIKLIFATTKIDNRL